MAEQLKPGPDGMLWGRDTSGEGLTETRLRLTEAGEEAQADQERALNRGLAKMTINGGRGQEGIVMVDGSVLTAKETAAKSVAIQVKAEAEASLAPKKFIDMTMMDFAVIARGMSERKECSDADVLRELMAMQNHSKYGGS